MFVVFYSSDGTESDVEVGDICLGVAGSQRFRRNERALRPDKCPNRRTTTINIVYAGSRRPPRILWPFFFCFCKCCRRKYLMLSLNPFT